jgi:alkanesulfonate monooxygenase SsuD/methylene tetrahydromethanopterin reductase-like flavin-dependent oxidoreductase (luciferase family)
MIRVDQTERTMEFDVMTRATTWGNVADLACRVEAAGFSGMLFTEGHQVPWMNIAAASLAAPTLHFSTGIAIAFARSPMISAEIAWELAQNTRGKFRLGLGSQVKAHIERRYASLFDKPALQMKDYVLAVKACLRAFRREGALQHDGPYYKLSLLPEQWTPARHDHEDVKVDISAVGPIMLRVAGEVADGVHVHPMHSMHYIEKRLLPGLAEGAKRAGRDPAKIDLIVPGIYRSARQARRPPQGPRQRGQPSADHRRDPRPVRRGSALGRRRRPHDRALQGRRFAAGHLSRLALARDRSQDPGTLGRSGTRGAQSSVKIDPSCLILLRDRPRL